MLIKTLSLTDFRSYANASFDFDPENTLIIGPNTSGKTNILEAIFLLAMGKSPRARFDKEMIKHEKRYARVKGKVEKGEEETLLEVFFEVDERYKNLARKKVKVNGVGKTQLDFVGKLRVVLFKPEDIELIISHPKVRRTYIDTIFTQIDRRYRYSLREYTRVILQRNRLLEKINEANSGWEQLEFWDAVLLNHGQVIQEKRQEFFNFLKGTLPKLGKLLDEGGGSLKVEYKQSPLSRQRQEEYQKKEVAAKLTLIGPHREDFEISWKGYNLAQFGSRSEKRTAVLALKLAELEFISEKGQERPVLLLDDIFSELDHKHRRQVLTTLGKQQTIITTTEIHLMEKDLSKDMKVIELNSLPSE